MFEPSPGNGFMDVHFLAESSKYIKIVFQEIACKTTFGKENPHEMYFHEIIFQQYYLNSIFAAMLLFVIPEEDS